MSVYDDYWEIVDLLEKIATTDYTPEASNENHKIFARALMYIIRNMKRKEHE